MGKIQISTGKENVTSNTTTVWDRIVALESNLDDIPENIGNTMESLETQLAQIATENIEKYRAGITGDWSPAIQSAVSNILTTNKNGKIIIPNNYTVSTQVLIDARSYTGNLLIIEGNGVINVPEGDIPALNSGVFKILTSDNDKLSIVFKNLTFVKPDSAGAVRYGTFINVATWRNVKLQNCVFSGGNTQVIIDSSYGCIIDKCQFTMFNQAIQLKNAANTTTIDKCTIRNGRKGIRVESNSATETTLNVKITENYIESLSNAAVEFYGVRWSKIESNYFEALDQEGDSFLSVTNDATKKVAIYLDGGLGTNVEASARNVIMNNIVGAGTLHIIYKNANSNVQLFDNLTVIDTDANNNNFSIDTNGAFEVKSLTESVPNAGINILGKGINMQAIVSPTFSNGWVKASVESEPIGYWRDSQGMVHLEGAISGGGVNSMAFNLPIGYRPLHDNLFVVNSNDAFGQVRINPNGDVIPRLGNNARFDLSGISFRAYGF